MAKTTRATLAQAYFRHGVPCLRIHANDALLDIELDYDTTISIRQLLDYLDDPELRKLLFR